MILLLHFELDFFVTEYCDVGRLLLPLLGGGMSPIQTVIVSQGDVNDFHHIQGVVGDLIAIRIQDVGVFLSPPL